MVPYLNFVNFFVATVLVALSGLLIVVLAAYVRAKYFSMTVFKTKYDDDEVEDFYLGSKKGSTIQNSRGSVQLASADKVEETLPVLNESPPETTPAPITSSPKPVAWAPPAPVVRVKTRAGSSNTSSSTTLASTEEDGLAASAAAVALSRDETAWASNSSHVFYARALHAIAIFSTIIYLRMLTVSMFMIYCYNTGGEFYPCQLLVFVIRLSVFFASSIRFS